MKFWLQSAAYVPPREADAPASSKRGWRSSAGTTAVDENEAVDTEAVDAPSSQSKPPTPDPKPVGDGLEADCGSRSSIYSHYPSRLVTPEGRAVKKI